MKMFSGFTNKTAENLLMHAGAFFKNFDVENDTFDSAVEAGKLLGASRGGGEFSAVPELRSIEVDGVRGKAKGLQVIDSWEVKLTANIMEVTTSVLADALAASETDSTTNVDYNIVKGKNVINLTDYIDNITFVGTLSGSDKPVIIQVYNALNSNGLTLTTEDKSESVITLEFEGHFDANKLDEPPFAIYYPKAA
ncbi:MULTISPECIES: hypothetical protein [unclassified Sutcliffiella]|uniref:hypothetical protein n=1 Tax=unclassified Sutcliffiella TaxID=2837532 RepID=UPI0030CA939D